MTKKARAWKMQTSVTNIFATVSDLLYVLRTRRSLFLEAGSSQSKLARIQKSRREEEEPDSDIEVRIIQYFSSLLIQLSFNSIS